MIDIQKEDIISWKKRIKDIEKKNQVKYKNRAHNSA